MCDTLTSDAVAKAEHARLRDMFACAALAGFCSQEALLLSENVPDDEIARACWRAADAMMVARNKGGDK
jgi:hypothetical protein